jgi:hypothetical protein
VGRPRQKEDLSDPRPTRSTGVLTHFIPLILGCEQMGSIRSEACGGGSRQYLWTTTQMSRQVASPLIGEVSLAVVRVRWGFASEDR